MARLIVLGAGKLQVPLIKYLKSQNHEIIVVSPKGDYPGFSYAHKAYYLDVRQKEEIAKIAHKEHIDGILTDQTDLPVKTAAYVARELDLPGIDYEVSRMFTQKELMHEKCRQLGVDVLRSELVSDLSEAKAAAEKLGFPLIIKPDDCQGSRGVHKILSAQDLNTYFNDSVSYSFDHHVLLEEYIDGVEYAVQGISYNHEFWNLLCFEKSLFKYPDTFVFNTAIYPPASEALKTRLYGISTRLIKGSGLRQGLSELEFIYSAERDRIYLLEMTARGAGAYISSHIIPSVCNINTKKFLMDIALGAPVDTSGFGQSKRAVGYLSFYLDGGSIEKIRGLDEILSTPELIVFPHDELIVGYEYHGLKDKSDRLGPIALAADSRDQLLDGLNRIKETLIINTAGGGGIIWD
jgi:carbamoyl-phosphate synthase large subunit